jgi:hypothetical protein
VFLLIISVFFSGVRGCEEVSLFRVTAPPPYLRAPTSLFAINILATFLFGDGILWKTTTRVSSNDYDAALLF